LNKLVQIPAKKIYCVYTISTTMAYSLIVSFIERTINTTLAPVRVAKDKIYDAFTYENTKNKDGESQKEIQRMYPKDVIAEYVSFFSSPQEVYPRIFLGSANNADCYYTLKDLGIKYVINVSAEITSYYPDYFTYYQISIRDDNIESIRPYFTPSFEKIEEFLANNDGNVFIHCFMGASRSATIVANYIAKKTHDDITTVLVDLKKKRPVVNLTNQYVSDLRAENA